MTVAIQPLPQKTKRLKLQYFGVLCYIIIMADSSFDITSKVDIQEADNAINQANREISTRYDLKDLNCEISFDRTNQKLSLSAPDDFKLKAITDILKLKLIKRDISPKALDFQPAQKALGDNIKQDVQLQQGISKEKAKEITKDIKKAKLKVQAQIQGEEIRVSAKKKDDLQAVIQLIKNEDYNLPLQFTNFR